MIVGSIEWRFLLSLFGDNGRKLKESREIQKSKNPKIQKKKLKERERKLPLREYPQHLGKEITVHSIDLNKTYTYC